VTRWRVTYASGARLVVMALDEAGAALQGWLHAGRGEAVVEVAAWTDPPPALTFPRHPTTFPGPRIP